LITILGKALFNVYEQEAFVLQGTSIRVVSYELNDRKRGERYNNIGRTLPRSSGGEKARLGEEVTPSNCR
jgi:hypothetical protein